MAIELRQQLKLTQQLVMTPQLQMAIRLLQLSRLELMDTIRQELEENPVLDEVLEDSAEELPYDSLEKPEEEVVTTKEVTIEEKIPDDVDWTNYIEEYNAPGKMNYESENRDSPKYESFIAEKESLTAHLLWQLRMGSFSDEEMGIGNIIIGNLNKDGYLQSSVGELAEMGGYQAEKIEQVLVAMQTFDPIGVCARNLSECLLIQARNLGCEVPIVVEIIKHHLNHLENKNYNAISKALKADITDIHAAVQIIKGFEPRPGRQFSDENPQYITPDIYVYKLDNEFVIVLNDDGMPKLRVNAIYQNAMNTEGKISESAKDYMQEKLKSAAWLIKSIHQRQKTIYKVMESILKYQRDFFDKGVAHLRPMVLRDVATDIEMHESTISRVTTNKYAYTPQGIFELKYFFNSSINRLNGDAIASASVQDKIRQIIESEDQIKPYSDDKIADMLKQSNIDIARRTVAKYREMMRILPSNKRKEI